MLPSTEVPSPERRRKQAKARNENFLKQFPRGGGLPLSPPPPSSLPARQQRQAPTGVSTQRGVAATGFDGGMGGDEGDDLLPLDELIAHWPGREQQINELAGLIGEPRDGVPVPPLLVTGPPCCGKTGVIRAVLDHRGCPYVYVNCAEVVRRKGLLETVMEQVAGGSREDILEVNRVDRSFRESQQDEMEEDRQEVTIHAHKESKGIEAESPEGEKDGPIDHVSLQRQEHELEQHHEEQQRWRSKGRPRPACSSWNVFFRQLAALLHRRALAAARQNDAEGQKRKKNGNLKSKSSKRCRKRSRGREGSCTPVGATTGGLGEEESGDCFDSYYDNKGDSGGVGQEDPDAGRVQEETGLLPDRDVASSAGADAAAAAASATRAASTTYYASASVFPCKVFVVLDQVEFLLGEFVAGVGVGAGGGVTSWRGPDLLERLGRLGEMVSSFSGFGAMSSSAGTGASSGFHVGGGGAAAALVSPILISQNVFFASEIMAAGIDGNGGGAAGGSGSGGGRSFVGRVCPVQLRFEPYGPKEMPEVLTRIAHCFGLDLDLESSENFPQSIDNGGVSSFRRGAKGRELFRKMAVQLVTSLRNETLDVWDLGAEAARLWPAYLKMTEDGFDDAELAAGLKPLLKETTKRLHAHQLGENVASNASDTSREMNKKGTTVNKKRRKTETRGMFDLGLSRSGKFVLVSAYLASHNARDADCDLFTVKRTRGPGKKSKVGANVGNAENLVEAGVQDLPEAREFQLERLLSIMSSIVAVSSADTKTANNMGSTELFLQVKSLTRLNLIRECGARRKMLELDAPSYRCCVSRELADSVAKEIGLELSQYLKTG